MHFLTEFGPHLDRLGLSGEGVEVGVCRGGSARRLLERWRGRKLWGVDLWAPQPDELYPDANNLDTAGHEDNYRAALAAAAPFGGRFEPLRMDSEAAAGRFADGSLDFVYLDANHLYPAVRRDLRAWYPKVREGGVIAGHDYLDGVIEEELRIADCGLPNGADPHPNSRSEYREKGKMAAPQSAGEDGGRGGVTVFGVKSAVDEFAAELGPHVQVCVTLDAHPAWHFVKRGPGSVAPLRRRDIAVITGHDGGQADVARYTTPNKRRYCERHGYRLIEKGPRDFDPSRPPAWSKVKFLRDHLAEHEWLFWTDVDSLVMDGSAPLERVVDDADRGGYDSVVTHEDLGVGLFNVNTGQWFVRGGDWSRGFLDEVWAQERFAEDRLWENRAVIHLLFQYDLSARVQIVSQRRFNSYPVNYQRGDFLLHFPGYDPALRLRLIRKFHQFAAVS